MEVPRKSKLALSNICEGFAPESDQRPPKGWRRKSIKNTLGERVYYGKFEPRFKPPGSKNYISVGGYEKEEDAKACYQILAFWFGKKGARGELPLGDGPLILFQACQSKRSALV